MGLLRFCGDFREVFVPKGLWDSAWGFNPRNTFQNDPPEGAIDSWDRRLVGLAFYLSQEVILPPLQHLEPATRVPFGLGAVLQHSHTPSLRVTGFEDSLSDEAHGLCCQPLEVGLASEARSTTGTLAKAEGRRRGRERKSL